MKKTWQSPQLIILTRSKSEESVLSFCKTDSVAGPYVDSDTCVQTVVTPCASVGSS